MKQISQGYSCRQAYQDSPCPGPSPLARESADVSLLPPYASLVMECFCEVIRAGKRTGMLLAQDLP